jgi:hypothetical protein
MGRPLSKKFFASGDGSQLGVRAKIAGSAEGSGSIVNQRGARRFKVNIAGTIGVCKLVDKADGLLLDGEMTISVTTDAGATKRVTKINNRTAVVDGVKTPWTFTVSAVDGKIQAGDAVDPATIVISVDPADVTSLTTASFSVTAAPSAGTYTLKYKWQVSTDAGATWSTITGETASTYDIADVTGLDGNQYRAVVSAKGLTTVNSAAATLTVA